MIEADVLMLGGAAVVLADKGFCGTSGVAATAGPGHWWVPPATRARTRTRTLLSQETSP